MSGVRSSVGKDKKLLAELLRKNISSYEVNFQAVKINLTLTFQVASKNLEEFDSRRKTNWNAFKPGGYLIRVCEANYDSIRTEYLPNIRHTIFQLNENLKPKKFSSFEAQIELAKGACLFIPVSDLIIKTIENLTEMYRNRALKRTSPTLLVLPEKIIEVGQNIEEVKDLWWELMAYYRYYLDEVPVMICCTDYCSDEWNKAVALYNQINELLNKSICKMICQDDPSPESAIQMSATISDNIENELISCFSSLKKTDELHSQISDRLTRLSPLIGKGYWRNDDISETNFFEGQYSVADFAGPEFGFSNLNSTTLKYIKSLKDELIALKESFSKVEGKIPYSHDNISMDQRQELLRLSHVITELIINSRIGIKISIDHFGETIKAKDNFRVNRSQLDLTQANIKKLCHCWLPLMECMGNFLLAFESTNSKTNEDIVDDYGDLKVYESKVMLKLEISWRFDLCFELVDLAHKDIKAYDCGGFLKDCRSLSLEIKKKIESIEGSIENNTVRGGFRIIALRHDGRSGDLEIHNGNKVFLKHWRMLLIIFNLFINKVSRKYRQTYKIYSLLSKNHSIMLVRELYRWTHNYCVRHQDGWWISRDKRMCDTAEGMIDSMKIFQIVLFDIEPGKLITKCIDRSNETDLSIKHIENIDAYLLEISQVEENDDYELQLWLRNWFNHLTCILRRCFNIHHQHLIAER
ncbi:hypothetical protein BY996DRAFT_6414825 [Phakopsora pachyrhizi]|nr:hypothetical protein BY996DRAFT_6414825 [Phakopsora pachyrhizi]